MISEAYIAGNIKKAIFIKDEQYYIAEQDEDNIHHTSPLGMMDMNSFLISKTESKHITDISWSEKQLYDELEYESGKFEALNFFLSALDSTLSNQLRKEAIEIFIEEGYSDNDSIMEFVKNRVLGTTLPEKFDPELAYALVGNPGSKLSILYKTLIDAKTIIKAVRHQWKKSISTLSDTVMPSATEVILIDKEFTDRGIYADIVLALYKGNKQETDNIVVKYAGQSKNIGLNNLPIFLDTLINKVTEELDIKLIAGIDASKNDYTEISQKYSDGNIEDDFEHKLSVLIDNFKGKRNSRFSKFKKRLVKNYIDADDVKKQTNWIKDKINSGDIERAKQDILYLVEYQNTRSDKEHLCKSLSEIATCFQKYNYFDLADFFAEKAKYIYPFDHVPYCILAHSLMVNTKLDEALKLYNQIIHDFPEEAYPYTGKGQTLKQLGRLDDALELYNKTIQKFPNNVVPYNGKAETLKQLGLLGDALEVYNQAIQKFPNEVVPYNGKAEILKQLGRLDEALNLYNKTNQRFPDDVVTYCGKAETLKELGRLNEALETYNNTIQKFPNEIVPYNGKAETIKQLGNLEDALKLLDQIIKKFQHNNKFAIASRFTLLVQMGKDIPEFENNNINMKPITIDDWIFYHIYCMYLIRNNRLEEAIEKLKYGVQNVTFTSSKFYFENALPYAYVKNRKFAEAIQHIKPDINPLSLVLATHAYAEVKDIKNSKKYFNNIKDSQVEQIKNVSQYLSDRYHLSDRKFHINKDNQELDSDIENTEFILLTNYRPLMAA